MELDKIPGLQEAVAAARKREAELREIAFLPITITVAGIECRQFTPRHFCYLNAARSPFVCGGAIAAEHIAQFLWVVSPAFRFGDQDAFHAFARELRLTLPRSRKSRLQIAIAAIDSYLDDALIDRPGGSNRRARAEMPAIAYFAAGVVNTIGCAYGWDDEAILDKPFARLFQYTKLIARRENPNLPDVNRHSDGVERQFIAAYQRKHRRKKKPGVKRKESRVRR